MKTSWLIALVIILLAAGGAFYFYRSQNSYAPALATPVSTISNSPVATPSTASDQGFTITVVSPSPAAKNLVTFVNAANGFAFTPSILTVKVGATVQFKNMSSEGMWVASNPHPIHTDYPGFDALRPYNRGDVYSFTFTKVGTWGYHDHLEPSVQGTIVVVP